MLTTWWQDNQTSEWSKGLRFVQLMKNKAFHSGTRPSSHEENVLANNTRTSQKHTEIIREEIVLTLDTSGTSHEYTVVMQQDGVLGMSADEIGHDNGNKLMDEALKSPLIVTEIVTNSIPEPINCVVCQTCSFYNTRCHICQNYFH